ncbi:hypothetical protein DH2020_039277 [Rehmannia glutinosa]|uniref:Pentatricopeptide repeat-containing protein n=1 Tax=Rehmannia glutinosa TaxID=99300 RepID=A0ABR0UXG9_REHGL
MIQVEGMNCLVSELADVAAQERAMLDECESVLGSTAAMQVSKSKFIAGSNSSSFPFVLPYSGCLMRARGGLERLPLSGTATNNSEVSSCSPDSITGHSVAGTVFYFMFLQNGNRGIAAPRDRNFFLSLIKQATTLSHLNQTHAQIIHNNLVSDNITITKLIQKLLDLKANDQAKLLFANTNSPDLFLYNVLIKGFRNNPFDSLSVYRSLLQKTGFRPDNFTYSFIIAAFSGFPASVSEKVGVLLHGHAIVSGFGSDLFVASALVDVYMSLSRIGNGYKVFDGIPEPDTVLWNTILSGLVKNCCFEESLREIRAGMMVQALAMKVGCHFHGHVLTCLVSLYSKCGDVVTAQLLFGLIGNPDLVAYNAMISGFSANNEAESSLNLFQELLLSGCKVSSSTIVGLIPVLNPFGHLDFTRSIHCFCLKSGFLFNPSISTALTTVYSRLNELELARKLFDESRRKLWHHGMP